MMSMLGPRSIRAPQAAPPTRRIGRALSYA
jgi:hypothetical protein